MPEIKNIAPALFQVGSLIAVSFKGPWSGEVTVKDEDLPLLQLERNNPYMKKGALMLLPDEGLAPFASLKKRVATRVANTSRPFVEEMPQVRLINNRDIQEIDDFLKAAMTEYEDIARNYALNVYPEARRVRQSDLALRFPMFRESLDSYYLAQDVLMARCRMKWLFFRVEDLDGMNTIMADQRQQFASSMSSFVHDMAAEFRLSAVKAALAFKQGLDRAKGTVDGRVVDKFKGFLDRIDRQDFLHDTQMREMLDGIRQRVFSVATWDVQDDSAALAEIQKHLAEVVEIGKQEGAAADVATSFIRTVSAETMEIEASDEQVLGVGQSDAVRRVTQSAMPEDSILGDAPVEILSGGFKMVSGPAEIEVETPAAPEPKSEAVKEEPSAPAASMEKVFAQANPDVP